MGLQMDPKYLNIRKNFKDKCESRFRPIGKTKEDIETIENLKQYMRYLFGKSGGPDSCNPFPYPRPVFIKKKETYVTFVEYANPKHQYNVDANYLEAKKSRTREEILKAKLMKHIKKINKLEQLKKNSK